MTTLRKKNSDLEHYLLKRFQFFKRKLLAYAVPTLIALIFFGLTIYLSPSGSDYYSNNGPELKLELKAYKKTSVYYNGSENVPDLLASYSQAVETGGSMAFEVKNVEEAILGKSIENIMYYKEHIIASAQFLRTTSEINAVALFNALAIHSSPISLNLVTNAIAKALLKEEYSISAANWPLESIKSNSSPKEFSETKVMLLWIMLIPIGCLFILGTFIIFPHIEISSRFAQLQYMCGVKPFCYWIVNLLADMLIYIITIVPLVIIICAFSRPFNGIYEFGILFLIMFMYGLAGIPFSYLFSRKKTASGAFALFIIMGVFLGIILSVVIGALIESGDEYYVNQGEILKYFSLLFIPQVALTYSGVEFARKAVNNYNMDVAPARMQTLCSYNPNPCCSDNVAACVKYKDYMPLLQTNFLLMFGSFAIYFILNILLDTYFLRKTMSHIWFKIQKVWYRMICHQITQYNTITKGDYAEDQPDTWSNSLRAKKLHKTYSGKSVVKDIDITLNHGECLGILGVNGAGKTTTFRMLTREEIVDEGEVGMRLHEKDIDINNDEYLETLGYCPQADALNYVLTGREILTVIARLRGVDNPKVVNAFLDLFDLTEYADKPCGYYSGGNKRKLSLAVSLIGYRKFVLLDEPTNGVDPSSRRKCWNLIKGVQEQKGLSFILTSHSMAECEALCNNLKIMKDGEFHKEGTISKLKKDFGGFSIKLKLKNKSIVNPQTSNFEKDVEEYDDVDSAPLLIKEDNLKFDTVENLKTYFITKYNSELKDEHSGLLHFYIKDKNKRWSTIFKDLEKIKESNPQLIEDYAISEASLEDVFLSVARSDDTTGKLTSDNGKSKKSNRGVTI